MGAKTRKLSQINDSLIEWQSVVVADGSTGLTAVAGRGYFINTTGGAITVTLPSATAKPGDTVQLKDYARTWATNNVTIASTILDGVTTTTTFSTNGQTVTLVYMDNTKGWSLVNEDTTSNLAPALFISATGGTVTTSGNFKIHTFTGDGCFVVSQTGNSPTNPLGGPTTVDYLVVAGGGGGGGGIGGGGGGGGFRESYSAPVSGPYTASPLATPTGITISATTYPITVGAGGTAGPAPSNTNAGPGGNSVFSTITSTGGGRGGYYNVPGANSPPFFTGGSGGGAGGNGSAGQPGIGGAGNTPPVSPPQGMAGGNAILCNPWASGGGGGATVAGTNGNPTQSGPGGAGATTSISGSPTTYSGGGGGGGTNYGGPGAGGTGGSGGAGAGGPSGGAGSAGTTNTGGGGGGGGQGPVQYSGAAGGSGIVIIRYKFQ